MKFKAALILLSLLAAKTASAGCNPCICGTGGGAPPPENCRPRAVQCTTGNGNVFTAQYTTAASADEPVDFQTFVYNGSAMVEAYCR